MRQFDRRDKFSKELRPLNEITNNLLDGAFKMLYETLEQFSRPIYELYLEDMKLGKKLT